ncbi:HAMP domain-containing protein,histidine kinase [Sphaerochaeta pleomorpha str. Grapes]|uniref:histidine kinase n=1 Tax=Sphaerochaeta pleomorpha (strain ATCC BAA-1885 / DSM 22778 / Grapes) TaxID=158190 RepID=G8QY55_SPHPG|nr:sensor histidine kinase [Sphaerochaeta pleomorpha]AEV29620.1 HAMP domain-containing protein,histidine kinase [Sphaerochaeta pleomorpha str. Grapes]
MANKSFFSKLLLSFMMVAIIPIVLLGILSMRISIGATRKQLEKQVSSAAIRAGETLALTFTDLQDRLDLFCQDPQLLSVLTSPTKGESEKQQIYQKIFFLLAGKSSRFEMHVIAMDSTIAVSTAYLPKTYNPKEFSSWGLLRTLGEVQGTKVYANRFSSESGTEMIASIGSAIRDTKGTILGYAIIDIPYQRIQEILDSVATELPLSYTILDTCQYLLYDDLSLGEGLPFITPANQSKITSESPSGFLQDFSDKKYLLSSAPFLDNQFTLLSAVPMDLVFQSNNLIAIIAVAMAFIALLFCLLFSWLLAKNFSTSLSKIVLVMGEAEQGNLKARTDVVRDDELGDLANGLNKMIENLDELFEENLQKQDNLRLAEIKQLQAQINPHFLYNTLDSIKYLAKLKMTDEIDTVISRLGTLLKSSINSKGGVETVKETMFIIKSYLELQQICYPGKFDFSMDLDPDIYSFVLPKLIIQPIVENAIIHGMGYKLGKCTLLIKGKVYAESIIFEIIDDGIGMDEELVASVLSPTSVRKETEGMSIGLKNIHRRIQLFFGNEYGLEIESSETFGTTVRIRLPISRQTGHADPVLPTGIFLS